MKDVTLLTSDILVDWDSSATHLAFNPAWDSAKLELLERAKLNLPALAAHVFIPTSSTGSLQSIKVVALSKEAFLNSAAAVNAHLGFFPKDIWLNPLPLYHVGGLSTHARAWLSGGKVVDCFKEDKWKTNEFYQILVESKATFTSLVPTQVYDLVKAKLKSPKTLKAAVIGGGHLSPDLQEEGLSLGWPLLSSYGMTECASQIATASYKDPGKMIPLSHIQLKFSDEGLIRVKSLSLCTGILHVQSEAVRYFDPRDKDGYYTTQDLGELKDGTLRVKGRQDDQIKISGELVSLQELESLLVSVLESCIELDSKHFALLSLPCARLENRICLVYDKSVTAKDAEEVLKLFNEKVFAPARIKELLSVNEIPRTELFKIKRKELNELVTKK